MGGSSLELDHLDEDCVDGVDDNEEEEEEEEEVPGYLGTSVPMPVLYSQNRHLRYSDSSLFDQVHGRGGKGRGECGGPWNPCRSKRNH